jgi:hypothetical protein
MFWLGQALTLVAGLLGIALIRAVIVRRFPMAREGHFDLALIAFLILGVTLAAREYRTELTETQALVEEVESLRDYSDVARLTFNGTLYTGGDIKWNTELSEIMEGTFVEAEPNRFRRVCTQGALEKNRQAILRFSHFPFSHYWLALCLRDQGNPEWRAHATTALSIFERTTKISGHQASHDDAKAYLEEILKEAK